MIAKLLEAPPVRLSGRPVRAVRVVVEEPPGRLPHATIDLTGLSEIVPGAPVSVVLSDGATFDGTADEVEETRTPSGVAWTVHVLAPSQKLDGEPTSLHLTKKTRGDLLRAMLAAGGLSASNVGAPDPTHERLTLLSEPRRPVAVRLALLGGRVLLFPVGRAVAVDPAKPEPAAPVTGFEVFHRRRRRPSTLKLVAPDPKTWGKVVTHTVTKDSPRRRVLRFGEAGTAEELAAAAAAIHAVEAVGDFHLAGGPALAAFAPGAWLSVRATGEALLVTGRSREWTPGQGWRTTLTGGYPWDGLTAPATADTEAAEVVGYDEATGLLQVRLPGHDDVVIDAGLRADRVADDELSVAVPAVGERGAVLFGAGCDQALYLGGAVPPGRFSKADFDTVVSLIRTAKLHRRYQKDGKACTELEQAEAIYRRHWNVKARDIDFDRV